MFNCVETKSKVIKNYNYVVCSTNNVELLQVNRLSLCIKNEKLMRRVVIAGWKEIQTKRSNGKEKTHYCWERKSVTK